MQGERASGASADGPVSGEQGLQVGLGFACACRFLRETELEYLAGDPWFSQREMALSCRAYCSLFLERGEYGFDRSFTKP